MERFQDEQKCKDFNEDVIVTVYYENVVVKGRSGPVPMRAECSGSPNGRCGKYDTCSVLRKAEDDVRHRRF